MFGIQLAAHQRSASRACQMRRDYYLSDSEQVIPRGTPGWIHGWDTKEPVVFEYLHQPSAGRALVMVDRESVDVGELARDPIPIETAHGLVYALPVQADLITGQYDYQRQVRVFKTIRPVRIHESGNVAVFFHGSLPIVIDRCVTQAGLRPGDSCQVVIELASDSLGELILHPNRYIRFPSQVGRNKHFEKLGSLAVRIEWRSYGTGQWKTVFVNHENLWEEIPEYPGMLRSLIHGLELIMIVTSVVFSDPKPAWVPPGRHMSLRYLHCSHKAQILRIKTPPRKVLEWPADHSMDENAYRLRQLYPRQFWTRLYIGSRPHIHGGPDRAKCDLCSTDSDVPLCETSHDGYSCKCCAYLNRPCTWNLGSDPFEGSGLGGELEELGLCTSAFPRPGPVMIENIETPADAAL